MLRLGRFQKLLVQTPWDIKTTLFTGATADDFLCSATGRPPAPPPPPPRPPTRTTHASPNRTAPGPLPPTSTISMCTMSRTAGSRPSGRAQTPSGSNRSRPHRRCRRSAPLLLTLQVPNGPVPSLSGIDYSARSSSPPTPTASTAGTRQSFPMWCVNRQTGLTKAPTIDNWAIPNAWTGPGCPPPASTGSKNSTRLTQMSTLTSPGTRLMARRSAGPQARREDCHLLQDRERQLHQGGEDRQPRQPRRVWEDPRAA